MKKYNKVFLILLTAIIISSAISQVANAAKISEDVFISRLAGNNRVATAIEISKEAYEDGTADSVILAGYAGDIDAVSGTLLAASKKAPLLFLDKDGVDPIIKTELKRLGVRNIYLLGGPKAISQAVEDQLETEYTVKRVAGINRYETAFEIAKEAKGSADHIFLTRGDVLADALAVGPVSAIEGKPILLTKSKALAEETIDAIGHLGVRQVTIVGGEKGVSKAIENELKNLEGIVKVDRVEGDSRYKTAVAIAKKHFKNPEQTIMANGEKYVDALAAGYLGALRGAPILLTKKTTIPSETKAYIEGNSSFLFVVGGDKVIDKIEQFVSLYYHTTKYEDTLEQALNKQATRNSIWKGGKWVRANKTEIKKFLNPEHFLQFEPKGEKTGIVTGTALNIRKGPCRTDDVIGKTTKGKVHKILSEKTEVIKKEGYVHVWYKINFNGKEGWVSSDYVDILAGQYASKLVSVKIKTTSLEGTVTASLLNVRTAPTTQAESFGKASNGQKYKILAESDGWYKINFKGKHGWVSSRYINLILDIRKEPNTTSSTISTRSNEQVHVVLDEKNGWYKINIDGNEGWIASKDANYVKDAPADMYQFMILSGQAGATSGQMNSELAGKGILEGKGKEFIEASKKYNVNELYLLAHALLETGNGSSRLAKGIKVDTVDGKAVEPKVVYNMYGIGAYDRNPERLGSEMAYKQRWFSVDTAIIEGAHWISRNYINSSYKQDTLYKMKYNPAIPSDHQYATDIEWAQKQRTQIEKIIEYCNKIDSTVLRFDIPKYK